MDSKEEAFSVLDAHFGDIKTVLPRLRGKLDKLPNFPEKEEIENSNIQHILSTTKQQEIIMFMKEQLMCTSSRNTLKSYQRKIRKF